MPVVVCSPLESRAIDCEAIVDLVMQQALEDRGPELRKRGAWDLALSKFTARATARKKSLLSLIVSSRVNECGEPATLPDDYDFVRDPVTNRALILWGDVYEDLGDGRRRLKPFVPLPPLVSQDDLDTLQSYKSRKRRSNDILGA